MDKLQQTINRIRNLDPAAAARAQARLDSLTKPPGSLGRLEEIARRLVMITNAERPSVNRKVVIVMAGDHGVAEEGVSAYPQEVTTQMVLNFLRGGAAINVLARHVGARLVVVDIGVKGELPALAPPPAMSFPSPSFSSFSPAGSADTEFFNRRIASGTRNCAREAAMTREQAVRAIVTGIEIVEQEIAGGAELIATGDMGIANTTVSSAIVAVTTGRPVEEVTGRGTGVDDAGLARKIAVIQQALRLHDLAPDATRPAPDALDVLTKVGGFEIGGLAGVILGAAAARRPVVLDGFISGAAGLIAAGLAPQAAAYCFAAHRSVERGHIAALEKLGLEPVLDLDLRLGEGTGAALAMHVIEAAAKIYHEMATFSEAGVSEKR
ncbi:MAG: nicotinate-nucleotide--dimethylbenzimidazole phosphoribosyltransferase [Verrucomicrobiae bacterium]|nr:nicotinate-nucleotide--dimethylbenzimidazole phosphoribosyltransferase [Verrucomicrobiae bacterium]